jgi:ATP-dependent DNA ligase
MAYSVKFVIGRFVWLGGALVKMPGFIKPQLATPKAKAPKGDRLHEIKHDGYRVQIHLNAGNKKVYHP